MSFINLVESELMDLKLTEEQRSSCEELEGLGWVRESSKEDPVYIKPDSDVRLKVTESGKFVEVEE